MSETNYPIQAIAFEETVAATAPIPIQSVSSPTPLDSMPVPNGRQSSSGSLPLQAADVVMKRSAQAKKDLTLDAMPPSSRSTARGSRTTMSPDDQSSYSLKSPASIPSIVIDDTATRPNSRWSERKWGALRGKQSTESDIGSQPTPHAEPPSFEGITLNIPTGSLEDLTMESIQFSKRGSLINGKSSSQAGASNPDTQQKGLPAFMQPSPTIYATRTISTDDDMLSRRVRLMYERGVESVTDMEVSRAMAQENGILWEEPTLTESGPDLVAEINGSVTDFRSISSVGANGSIKRETLELAGGIEDWQNVEAGDVDRYGFIIPRSSTKDGRDSLPDAHPIQRVSTSLLLASETPRRKHALVRVPSSTASNRSFAGRSPTRKFSDSSNRPSSSQSAYTSILRRSPSRLRYATNHLPYNRDRRLRDEAADMLTLPLNISESNEEDAPASHAMKKKEWEREDKWMKMAKLTKKTHDGGGMTFEFDTHSSKLINRTWKGIPDSWRATAWYAFLEASAKRSKDGPSESKLIQAYHEFQDMSSPDDLQIDIDVPRTICSHIMFRRRYRGGQRLLFRVLHAMSLYFPDTGYVQGMAALAATLLAYYDEEHAFIMLVRLWQLRGLERLYKSEFAGLMEALNDFEKDWLDGGELAAKLSELGISPTAYGTRWYLTLFNYSIPFPAQLRVWDVFMLLGDPDDLTTRRPMSSNTVAGSGPFGRSLDVLHATSAALIDGMREILLESDFENAMKVLTSWVPIKDIELFMRVAKAEFKVHNRRRAA
ncbi:hypothetical protein Egran_00692 [Elaphomyces granulatus]|uniref:Rab-GAP TBC domain-containing protein n=1 Tax=Elaphomyces granulatus TaxID=519963 RepID=A0A232M585_9EURO|nr:hypothetical protein Egran_00692 [Elaphomyces granulatus]